MFKREAEYKFQEVCDECNMPEMGPNGRGYRVISITRDAKDRIKDLHFIDQDLSRSEAYDAARQLRLRYDNSNACIEIRILPKRVVK